MSKRNGKPKLTPQQRALVKNLIKGMSITDAALKAGYTDKSRVAAGQAGSQALENLRLKMPEVLEKAGLTDEVLTEKYLKPLLRAKETKFFAHEGKVTDHRDVAALGIRSNALDMTFNLKGSYAPKAIEGGGPINIKEVKVQIIRVGLQEQDGSLATSHSITTEAGTAS